MRHMVRILKTPHSSRARELRLKKKKLLFVTIFERRSGFRCVIKKFTGQAHVYQADLQ